MLLPNFQLFPVNAPQPHNRTISHQRIPQYGAQEFSLQNLFDIIQDCKDRGVYVVLSIDGTKKNGKQKTSINVPADLFEREAAVNCGRSMLRRFQMEGQTLEDEVVTDRLLLTY